MGKVATFVELSSGKLGKKVVNIKTNRKLDRKEQDVNFFRHCITEET